MNFAARKVLLAKMKLPDHAQLLVKFLSKKIFDFDFVILIIILAKSIILVSLFDTKVIILFVAFFSNANRDP